ncbi:hypothetical protein [Microcoleus sp. CAWBG58]|uniref:hypothetical protein n=1 Tax=Microcoleus sp. CAWBG58 TaxID=2841651 RepID=UPI0025DADEE8|nr:hypothetical protein [Microcoleus sp. CAWBG58]
MRIQKEWQIFSVFLGLFALLTRPVATSNDASRLATIESLVDFHTFIIDNSRFIWTIDKYLYQGHFYSDKPPILSIYGSFFYALLKVFGISFKNQFMLTNTLLIILVVGVATATGIVYLYRIFKFLAVEETWIDVVIIIAGTGTLLLPYSTVFSNHVVSASLLMAGFYYLLRVKESIRYSLLSGLLITLAGSIDVVAFIFVPFFAVSFFNKPLKSKIVFALAGALVMVIYLQLNFYTSGSLRPPSMNQSLWEYPGSAFDSTTLSGLAYHSNFPALLNYAFHMIIGHRGLISYTPILVFSIFGFVKILRNKEFKYRQEYLLILLASSAYVLMYILRSNNYSGYSYGVRWYANLMFLLCLPLAQISEDIKSSKNLRKAFIFVSCLSIIISFVGVNHPFVAVSEQHPSSFLNALMYIFKPIDTQVYGDNQAMKLSFSHSLLFALKQLRVIVIAALAGLSCYLLVNRVKQFVANRPLVKSSID